jgi:predicted DNA-binding transcriptional regulator YafY
LDSLSPAIPPAQQATLSSLADQIIQQLQGAINGRDAFFPADQLPSAGLVDHIQQAVEHSSRLTFSYLPLNATAPKEHTVEPLRLEQRGRLTYLYAYSYRAEANLIFRLDRVKEIVAGG